MVRMVKSKGEQNLHNQTVSLKVLSNASGPSKNIIAKLVTESVSYRDKLKAEKIITNSIIIYECG